MAKKYKIYAGLDGCSKAQYICTDEFNNEDEALEAAYNAACEEYDSHAGLHGIPSIGDIEELLREKWGEEPSEDDIWEAYCEERESWIDYYVEEIEE